MSRELDRRVAEEVLDQPTGMDNHEGRNETVYVLTDCPNEFGICPEVPPYSTNIAAAWEVVEKMRDGGWETIEIKASDRGTWLVFFGAYPKGTTEKASTAPEAICLAALAAKEKA